jgi:hypothetical protein
VSTLASSTLDDAYSGQRPQARKVVSTLKPSKLFQAPPHISYWVSSSYVKTKDTSFHILGMSNVRNSTLILHSRSKIQCCISNCIWPMLNVESMLMQTEYNVQIILTANSNIYTFTCTMRLPPYQCKLPWGQNPIANCKKRKKECRYFFYPDMQCSFNRLPPMSA